jgi:hypothetical protein
MLACWALTAGMLLCGLAAHAQPVLKLRFPFDDVSGTTTPSDTSNGGVAATLQMLNYAGAATDYHGPANSGVAGAITGSRALNFSSNTRSGANGPVTTVTNATLGFGQVSAFTVTMWWKKLDGWQSDGYGPRMFVMGAPGFDDINTTVNSMGIKYQAANQLQFSMNTGNPTASATFAANLPTNVWIFMAITYDGTNVKIYEGTDTSGSTLISTTSAPGQIIDFGSTGAICIGNRRAKSRDFDGWIDDFRFYIGAADATFVENLRSTAAGNPPVVNNVYPDGLMLQEATNTLSFTASSPGGYAITNVQVLLNGADVSSSLVITGPASSKTVTYPGLQLDQVYTAAIEAWDTNGSFGTFNVVFDTFNPTNFIWEAEDFDFSVNGVGGQFIDNPVYTSTPQANSYFGQIGTEGIDEHQATVDGVSTYRLGDETATVTIVGELLRQNILNAQALDPAVVDHVIGYWENTEWVNYTRTYPAGKYNVYARVSAGQGAASIALGQVTSGVGTSSQTVSPLGTFTSSGSSWNSYFYVPLRDTAGNLVVLNLDGTVKTLRATAGSGNNVNFYMLAAANTNLPTISNVYPDGQKLFEATNRFVFTVSSPAGINANSIQLTLGATNVATQFGSNVTAQLVITGSATSRNVSYTGLLPNLTYTVVISATDLNGNTVASTVTFDTYSPSFTWEAEEFDFSSGQFIDNPAYTPAAQGNSYYGQAGTPGVDEGGATGTGVGPGSYRPAPELVNTPLATDATRQKFIDAGVPDHIVGNANGNGGQWMNYTKTFPAGTYNVYVRAACAGAASLRLQQVTAGRGTPVQGLAPIGTFAFTGAGWSSYGYVPLRDPYGNLANVTFTGAATTLRLTEDAIGNMNFFMLLPPRTDLARIDQVYPDGSTRLQATNRFSFTASSSYGINTTNIQVTLNGANVWSSLAFSGSASSWNVSYTGLALNTNYTAVIQVTDTNGSSATATVYFDTFSPANFTWQAEDYDFNGGQYIDTPTPTSAAAANSYFGQLAVGYVDEDYVQTVTGETYLYRGGSGDDWIGTQVSGDSPLPSYAAAQRIDGSVQNYNVAWWQTNAWMNYTRTFPTGNFYVYGRLAGVTAGNPYTNELDKVISGWGTSTQTTQPLGIFRSVGAGVGVWQWVPLSANGQPALVSLSGTNTLRVTTLSGGANADFFMLVPAPAAAVSMTASLSGSNIILSFPTQPGFSYTVQYKDGLTAGTWTPLGAAVAGDGFVKSVSDGPLGVGRFYRLAIQ